MFSHVFYVFFFKNSRSIVNMSIFLCCCLHFSYAAAHPFLILLLVLFFHCCLHFSSAAAHNFLMLLLTFCSFKTVTSNFFFCYCCALQQTISSQIMQLLYTAVQTCTTSSSELNMSNS